MISAVHHLVKRKRAVAAVSSQSPSNSSISTDQASPGANPAAAFGPNEWLVDEIYQQYLQDPNSVDRAWWDFFADYKPGSSGTADKPVPGVPATAAAVDPGPGRTGHPGAGP
ncbi:2-oxoglutarate dehydrogenase E1 component, partial [Streptomyces sp. DvalAA-43]